MVLGVVSDTHGNVEGLRQAVSMMLEAAPIDLFVHLGDDYDDALIFEEYDRDYLRVPGVFSEYYADPSIPNRVIKEFEGWRFLLTHTDVSHANDLPSDLKPQNLIRAKQVDVILHGHTHIPRLEEIDGILFINPGHLKEKDKKGREPSFAIVEVVPDLLKARLVGLKGGEQIASIEIRKHLK